MQNPAAVATIASLVLVALLGLILHSLDRWEPDMARWSPAPQGPGRHRLEIATSPYRPALPCADYRQPLTPFETSAGVVVIAGLDTWDTDTHVIPALLSPAR